MDNIDYFESIGHGEEEAVSARGRVELLKRQTCTRFEPYQEYFSGLPIARVVPARPVFTATASRSLRDYLQPQRQVKYLRGVTQQDYCQESLEELLSEEQHQPLRKLRNTSALLADTVYWAEETKVRSVKLSDFMGREKVQGREQWSVGTPSPKLLVDLHEWIYQLAAVGQELYARTPRAVFVLSPTSGNVLRKVSVEEELINWHHRAAGGGEQERLLLTTYHDRFSQLYEHGKEKLQLWCKIDGLVNSLWARTASEVVLCKENAILVADRRRKAVHDLQRRARVHENRIYAGISLANTTLGSRYFATTESFEVCIYDMRSPHEPILKIPHYCEEAPPSVLQTWTTPAGVLEPALDSYEALISSVKQWREENSLLIAHSPYAGGSSLFTELSINWQTPQELVKLQFKGETNQFANRFRLLYDPGKLQEHYHPRAVTAFQPAEGELAFLHLDNFHGLSLEVFQRTPANLALKNYKTAPQNFVYQRINFGMQEAVNDLQPANQEWFERQHTEKQLEGKSEDHWTDALSEEGLELEEEPFEQRVVRFADLKQFYHRVHEQAQQIDLQERIKGEEATARKDTVPIHNTRIQPTQSQTQREENVIRQGMRTGHLSDEAIGDLLEQWASL